MNTLVNAYPTKVQRNTLSKLVCGKAITNNNILNAIKQHNAKADKTTGNETQTASTSSSKKSNKTLKRKAEHCYQYDSSESEDEEKCCVCNKFTPQAVRLRFNCFY